MLKKQSHIRAYSSNLLRKIIVRNNLPFFKIFSNFVHFRLNFQIFCPFLNIFLPFFLKNRMHALTIYLIIHVTILSNNAVLCAYFQKFHEAFKTARIGCIMSWLINSKSTLNSPLEKHYNCLKSTKN